MHCAYHETNFYLGNVYHHLIIISHKCMKIRNLIMNNKYIYLPKNCITHYVLLIHYTHNKYIRISYIT